MVRTTPGSGWIGKNCYQNCYRDCYHRPPRVARVLVRLAPPAGPAPWSR